MVAHNNSLILEDFNKGIELCNFLDPILQKAFDSLNNVEIPEAEIENISLNTIATVHEPTRAFVNDYHNFSTGLTGIINQNTEIFTNIDRIISPISAILDSSSLGFLNISESLKGSLGTIELAKNTLLSSKSFASLNSVTDNYNKLFSDASQGFVSGFEGLKTNLEFSKYLNIANDFYIKQEEEEAK